MTLMEYIDAKRKTVEAIRLREDELTKTQIYWEDYYKVKKALLRLHRELIDLDLWFTETYYGWAFRDVLIDAFANGEINIPQEIIARIDQKRKELIEERKRELDAVND